MKVRVKVLIPRRDDGADDPRVITEEEGADGGEDCGNIVDGSWFGMSDFGVPCSGSEVDHDAKREAVY